MNQQPPNSLIHSASPYLQQHAYNPVDWVEWNDEVWERAKRENKLVLVSVGYSTCHWCHVMAHESFESNEVAELMNHHFINIKVDREERPDVDMIYMDACQLMTGRGGWPLNVVCMPNQQPIYAGTYFPKDRWISVVEQLGLVWKNEPEKVMDYGAKMLAQMQKMNVHGTGDGASDAGASGAVDGTADEGNAREGTAHAVNARETSAAEGLFQRQSLVEAYERLLEELDYENGGMNRTPKFPLPGLFEFLLNMQLVGEDPQGKDALHLTLLKMSHGGIYDVVRGGFCRYSTDGRWFAPHFEKMLYDNAQLISLYARAYAWSGADYYKEIVESCISFIDRELRINLDNGSGHLIGSALDADSEGIEGRYYVFTWQELTELLTEEELEFGRVYYGFEEGGNWEHGFNIVYQAKAPLEVLDILGIDAGTFQGRRLLVNQKLHAAQGQRARPSFDYKSITTWNSLYLKSLCSAYTYCGMQNCADAAQELGETLWNQLYHSPTQTLLRIYNPKAASKSSIPGFLEDYVFLADAYIHVYQITADSLWLNRAETLIDIALQKFAPQGKLPFFMPVDQTQLLLNKVEITDDVIPSSAATFAHCLYQLSAILPPTSKTLQYSKIARSWLLQILPNAVQQPAWHFQWLSLAQNMIWGGLMFKTNQQPNPETLQLLKAKFPDWTLLHFENASIINENPTNSECPTNISVCTAQICMPPVSDPHQAIELAADYLLIN